MIDPWRSLIEQHVREEPGDVRVEIIIGQVLKIEPRNQAAKNRVARILKELGFAPEMRSEGKHGRFRVWTRSKKGITKQDQSPPSAPPAIKREATKLAAERDRREEREALLKDIREAVREGVFEAIADYEKQHQSWLNTKDPW